MKLLTRFSLMTFVLALISCGGSKTITVPPASSIDSSNINFSSSDLKGKWSITSITPANDSASRSIGEVFITFADSSFGGKAPCNHIGGAYNTTTAHAIKFSKIISTKMACERMAEENTFIDYLTNKVSVFSIVNNSLLLKDSTGRNLIILRKGD